MKRSVNFRGSAPMGFGVSPGYRSKLPCGCVIGIGMESASLKECALHAAAPELLAACQRALDEMGDTVAADCAWCGGEGGWTSGPNPRMTPVQHRENCPILVIRAAIAKAEGR